MHDSDATTVLLNVYVYIVFVGKDYSTLVFSHLPHLTRLDLVQSDNTSDEHLKKIVAALQELVVIYEYGEIVVAMKNKPTNSSNSGDTGDEWSDTDE